jgi:hypothetical protein
LASKLGKADVYFLIKMLSEKEDAVRYNSFLLLQNSSLELPYTYEHWNELEKKLGSDNSYQRSIGLMLIAKNVKWDKEGKFEKALRRYLKCCADEKFITARQAIQGLTTIIKTNSKYNEKIEKSLRNLQLSNYKENQQKLLNKDITATLKMLRIKI